MQSCILGQHHHKCSTSYCLCVLKYQTHSTITPCSKHKTYSSPTLLPAVSRTVHQHAYLIAAALLHVTPPPRLACSARRDHSADRRPPRRSTTAPAPARARTTTTATATSAARRFASVNVDVEQRVRRVHVHVQRQRQERDARLAVQSDADTAEARGGHRLAGVFRFRLIYTVGVIGVPCHVDCLLILLFLFGLLFFWDFAVTSCHETACHLGETLFSPPPPTLLRCHLYHLYGATHHQASPRPLSLSLPRLLSFFVSTLDDSSLEDS